MQTNNQTLDLARELRSHMSLPEVILWRSLRGSRLGVKFRRQHPVGDYIVDFYCSEAKVAVEVDGQGHSFGGHGAYDARRDARLAQYGVRVIRVPSRTVLQDIDVALTTIRLALADRISSPGLPGRRLRSTQASA